MHGVDPSLCPGAGELCAPTMSKEGTAERRIVRFYQDEEQHWVAELECGHTQHVRHDPPWQVRPWVITEEGRRRFLGTALNCPRCELGASTS